MIGVVVPAHDEEACIGACLQSILQAARCPGLDGETVLIVAVLDACADGTGRIAQRMGATTVEVQARNVGIARAHGAELALAAGARWLAFTDADSTVAPDWITRQLALGSDAVCGTITVGDWNAAGWGVCTQPMRQQHLETYTDADGHRHIHGANLGVSATAYRGAGGFAPLASHEDVALIDALTRHGATIAWSAAPRVTTSARRSHRAPGGFGAALASVEREVVAALSAVWPAPAMP